jgi:transposase-like protein
VWVRRFREAELGIARRTLTIGQRTPAIMQSVETAPYAVVRFGRAFPDEASCLEWLKNYVYPAGITCHNRACPRYRQVTKHYRVLSRRSYCCAHCGHHVHPTADTIFHKSPTPLRLWFYAAYMMASTGGDIPARELQRELKVTYKTAWRMWTQIRVLLDNGMPGTRRGRPLGLVSAIVRVVDTEHPRSIASREAR